MNNDSSMITFEHSSLKPLLNEQNSILRACKFLHIPPLFLKWSESFHMRGILRSDKLITALHGSWVPSVSNL